MTENMQRRETLVNDSMTEHHHRLKRVVLICLDESSGKQAFHWALSNFVQPERDLVILVHVRLIDIPMAPYINATGYLDDVSEQRREESHHLLREFADILVQRHIACKAISMTGDPKTEIIRKVAETKTDVVIMGSRNLGALKRALLGSVSDYVVRHSQCTVIIAKPTGYSSQS
ncbi:uncharacterized protein BYT42DRAFT_129898 [Radiomyces spectabilis]|uniref:uncharacterized protein n=1 Tax=Radiomyces spectabilis TaxID=64574 RepID=UPI00221EC314|nr:uncharacterized protein BYT42DRAFT_129898 [Radiomyces spectabilis]KAI8367544.1 hypothetical protein BYT42DRAFT_129898 [Radiomyces spectabilis]